MAIVTGDKDFFQLVNDHIKVFNPRDEGTWYDANGVKEKFGVLPEQVVDVLALMGDSIDNIKGVPGIGEKGARDLISTHGSLDKLLENAASLTQKKYREALLANADAARDSRVLLQIRTDVPLPGIENCSFEYKGIDRQKCFELFSALGFRSLVTEFAPTADTVGADYAVVSSAADLAALTSSLERAGRFAISVIGDCPGGMRSSFVGISFSTGPRWARYLPVGHTSLEAPPDISSKEAFAALKPLLENPALGKVGHDLKFDLMMLAHEGIELKGLEFDTMLADYVLDPTRSSHTIEEAALEHIGYKALQQEDVCGSGQRAIALPQLPAEALLNFAGERADLAWQLAGALAEKLKDARLDTLFRELEMPLIPVLAAIERRGVRIDLPALASQSQRIDAELASRSAKIFELAGEEFNINSPKQLSVILFDKLQLAAGKRTGKTKVASTAVDVLEDLALTHELPRLILEWRALMKLKGTYIDALPQLIHSRTARVHTSFNQAVAATGRLSSSDPNLQNIPIRTDLGREIRRAFIAEPDFVLISADYSQIELRVLAHLAQEEALIDAFKRGEDIHDRTALSVFGAQQRPGQARAAPPREDHQLRAAVRKDGVHALARHRRDARGGPAVHRRLFRRVSARPRLHRSDHRAGAREGLRGDDVRPATDGAGAAKPQQSDQDGIGAYDGELPHPGHRRGHPEARHAGAAPEAGSRPGAQDDPDGARRAADREPSSGSQTRWPKPFATPCRTPCSWRCRSPWTWASGRTGARRNRDHHPAQRAPDLAQEHRSRCAESALPAAPAQSRGVPGGRQRARHAARPHAQGFRHRHLRASVRGEAPLPKLLDYRPAVPAGAREVRHEGHRGGHLQEADSRRGPKRSRRRRCPPQRPPRMTRSKRTPKTSIA